MAKSTKNAKSGQQAATKASGQKSATTGAKVAKVAKSAAKAPAKSTPAKPAKASGQQARRSQFAGKSITNLVPKGETPCRGGALTRFEAIVRHKKADDAIGSTYRIEGEKEDRTITAADVAYLVKRELISVK